jgi:GNAT superfamily N-acetyltransferase
LQKIARIPHHPRQKFGHAASHREAPLTRSHAIRAAQPADAQALIALDHIARSYPERRAAIDAAIRERRSLVIEVLGTVRGYSVISHAFFGRSFIDLVYIEEGHRNQGLGPELLRATEALSLSDWLFSSTNHSNAHMQHVFAKLGYEPSGVIYNLDEGDPELVYAKRLG